MRTYQEAVWRRFVQTRLVDLDVHTSSAAARRELLSPIGRVIANYSVHASPYAPSRPTPGERLFRRPPSTFRRAFRLLVRSLAVASKYELRCSHDIADELACVLTQASDEQLNALRAADFTDLFTSSHVPLREAALIALARVAGPPSAVAQEDGSDEQPPDTDTTRPTASRAFRSPLTIAVRRGSV